MNKEILLLLALSWVLTSCVNHATQFEGSRIGGNALSFTGCGSPAPLVCSGDKNKPKVTVDLDTMTASPECINAKKGKTITIFLKSTSKIEKGSVIAVPKKLENSSWVTRTNWPSRNKIKIKVPTKKKSGATFPIGIYNYGISTPTDCLDPRIEVTN